MTKTRFIIYLLHQKRLRIIGPITKRQYCKAAFVQPSRIVDDIKVSVLTSTRPRTTMFCYV
jgi:hypothetical protein